MLRIGAADVPRLSGFRGSPGRVRYAVAFRTGIGLPISGALTLDEAGLVLLGRSDDNVELSIPYSAVCGVRIGRSEEETVNGRPKVTLARRSAPSAQIEPPGAGAPPRTCRRARGARG